MAADNSSQLLSIIASYLRKRGLVTTLATFLSESDIKTNDEIGEVDLETLYNIYMSRQASVGSGISKKRKKKLEIVDDLSEKRPNLTGQSNGKNDQGFESLGGSVVTANTGNSCLDGHGLVPSNLSFDVLTRNEGKAQMKKGGEMIERHMTMQGQQHALDGTVRQKKKQMKETDNSGHHSSAPVPQECEVGKSNVETSNGKQKLSKKTKLKMNGSTTDEKWHEEAQIAKEKQNRKKKGCKKEADGASDEMNTAAGSFELKDKIDFARTQKSDKKLNKKDKFEDNNPENNLEKKSIKKRKKVKDGVDVNQQVFSQAMQLHADSTTQEKACASYDKTIAFVETGQIQHTGDLNCDAIPSKSKKSGKTKKKHGCDVLPGCDIVLQNSVFKKCQELESLELSKIEKSLEEDGTVTKKQKISRKAEQGVSKPSFVDNVITTANKTGADFENQNMMEGATRIQIHSQPKSAFLMDSSFQLGESPIKHDIIEPENQKTVEIDGASARKKKHRKEVSVKLDDSVYTPDSMEVLTERAKQEAEVSRKPTGTADMVDSKDNCMSSVKKEKKSKESGKKKKATCETEAIEVDLTSTSANGNLITALRETQQSLEEIDKCKEEVVDAFVGNHEATAVKIKKKKDTSSHIDQPPGSLAFRRVNINQVQYSDSRLKDNSYWAKGGAEQGYGAKAQEQLELVRGRDFRHEKTKKKRGSYRGGLIDVQSHSIKFDHSDED